MKKVIYFICFTIGTIVSGCSTDELTEEPIYTTNIIPFVGGTYDKLGEEYDPMPSPSEYVFPVEGGSIEIVSLNKIPGIVLGFLPVWDAIEQPLPPVETAGVIDWVDMQKGLYFQEKDGWRLENTSRGTIILTVAPNPTEKTRTVGCTRVYSCFGSGVRFTPVSYTQKGL